jgi:hypothetical protein
MDRRKTTKGLKLSSTGTLVVTLGLFAGAIIAWTPVAAARIIDCGGFSTAITECDDVSPRTDSFTMDDIQHSVSGRILSLTVSADGKRLYAGSFSGVWRRDSDNADVTWRQLTRPQPPSSTDAVPGALTVPNVFDVVVSPADKDVVLAATAYDTRVPAGSGNGIYRSSDGGNSWSRVHQFGCPGFAGAAAQIVFAPDDSRLLYAAGGCAVAISRDGGVTWLEVSPPAGWTVWHIAVAIQECLPSEDTPIFHPGRRLCIAGFSAGRRVYAAGNNQIWYSRDGGSTWARDNSSTLADISSKQGSEGRAPFGGFPEGGGSGNSAHILAVEPGHPDHVYLAVSGLSNGPSYYQPSWAGPDGTFCNVPGGPRKCGEGSLWLGDYSAFSPSPTQHAVWTQQPSPPAYVHNSTGSGNVYVETKKRPQGGYLLFFSDHSHVHVSAGRPSAQAWLGWHRLDGRDASQGWCEGIFGNEEDNGKHPGNKLFLHVDPHAFAVSPNFDLSLATPSCATGGVTPSPYNQNSVLASFLGGTMWMANDGGVYHSLRDRTVDGGFRWELESGLATLQPQLNFAGVALTGKDPALYIGVPDNDKFFSLDGGSTWNDPGHSCGDCGPWFSDPAQPNRVLEFDRGLTWSLFVNPLAYQYPDPSNPAHAHINRPVPASDAPASNWADEDSPVSKGYKPVVLTLRSEPPLSDGDYIIIRNNKDGRRILRTKKLSTITGAADWDAQGPAFLDEMRNANVVQASGGHSNTVFYVGDPDSTMSVWRWPNDLGTWKRIVGPNDGSHKIAQRFFVDPYNSSRIYIIDKAAIRRSEDGGQTWQLDASLDNLVTENGSFSHDIVNLPGSVDQGIVIKDMLFDRNERNTRFAVGNAGVFFTVDGDHWGRLLSSTALPGHPVAAYFDGVSNPLDRSLYVAVNGRGILRLHPIPPADTVKIESATLHNFPLNGHQAQGLQVSATSSAFPDAQLHVSVPGCVLDKAMNPAQNDYFVQTIVSCPLEVGHTATVISSFGGSASARVVVPKK